MSNNYIDVSFAELGILLQEKGYLLFNDIERVAENLSLNEVDLLTNRLLAEGIEIFDDVPDTIKNGQVLKKSKKQDGDIETLLFLKYKTLRAVGRMIGPKEFVVYKDSEYNEEHTSSCVASIGKRRRELMVSGKMRNGKLTEDVKFSSPSTAAKVLIGNSVNGKIVWVDSNGDTLKQLLTENEKRVNGE